MDPISVPAPPRSAYNPSRRVSDLLYSQLQHFQHIEKKRGDLGINPALARNIHTEGGAALYIAAVTNALRKTNEPTPTNLAPVPAPTPAQTPPTPAPVALAAAPATPPKKAAKKSAKKHTGKR
jgi:hypothetical protein